MKRLLIATRNRHKVEEIQSMLGGMFECVSLRQFPGAPEVVEDAPSFEGNALKKAEGLARWLRQTRSAECRVQREISLVLSDDSGLEVDFLNGAPGVYSARFAALDTGTTGNSPDTENNAKLLRLLEHVPLEQRTARFRCVIALVSVDPHSEAPASQSFDGVCEGVIGLEAHGDHGFGYDPLFVPAGFEQTFAQLGEETKNRISHRSRALERLKSTLA
jgi:XTP/dITP diphosphohydrolase